MNKYTANWSRSCAKRYGLGIVLTLAACTSFAGDLIVRVEGITSAKGEIGCALHSESEKFPMGSTPIQQLWLPAESPVTICTFKNAAPGKVAVAASQDLNGNKKVDTNFVGIPTEPWGVSNNVRPSLRAPRFSEAAIVMPDKGDLQITIQLSK
jgi:uncharacterized protein (DUF2141 family)